MPKRIYNREETATVQQWLNDHGFNCGKVDGIIGNKTRNAIKQAQTWLKDQGLYTGNIDGIVGEKTLAGIVTYSDLENEGGYSGLKYSSSNAPWQTPSDVREGTPDCAGILPDVVSIAEAPKKEIKNKQTKAKQKIADNYGHTNRGHVYRKGDAGHALGALWNWIKSKSVAFQ